MGKDPGLPDVYKEKLLSEHFRRRWSEYQKCITMIMDRRTQRLNQALQHNPQLVSEKPEIATLFPHQAFLNAAGSKSSPYPGLKTAKEEKIERMRTAAAAEGHKLVPSMTLSDICEAAFELVASKSPEFGPPLSKYPAAKQLRAMGIIAE